MMPPPRRIGTRAFIDLLSEISNGHICEDGFCQYIATTTGVVCLIAKDNYRYTFFSEDLDLRYPIRLRVDKFNGSEEMQFYDIKDKEDLIESLPSIILMHSI